MKTQLARAAFFLLICLALPLTTAAQSVDIPDSNLRTAIEKALNKPSGAAITVAEIETLNRLDARNANISDLTGLDSAVNLTNLNLASNMISDIARLDSLTNLADLNLANNMVSDISPVASLTNLTNLNLAKNAISDIAAVSGLTNLTLLFLGGNTISDVSPLVANKGLGSGDRIDVHGNALNYASIHTHVPALEERGVEVMFDNRTPRSIRIVSGEDQEGASGSALANPFIVEVRDGTGSAFEGVPVTFSVTAGGGTLSATNTTTGANGRAETTLTLGPGAGTNTVEVTADGIQGKKVFNAEGTRAPMSLKIISGNEQQGQPGAALEKPFVVEVRDHSDNPLPEVQVTFSVSSGGGSLSAASVTTDASGRAESTLTLGPEPGTNTVAVAIADVQGEQTFTAEGVRIPTSLEIISGDDQQGQPGAALEKPFVVEVRDKSDNPLPDVQVTFSVTSGGGTLSATTPTTDSNGRVESRLTLGPNPGTNTVTVSVTGIQEERTFNAEGIRIPKAFWIISGIDQQGVIGEALAHPFVVEVRDQSGEPMSGVEVMFSVTAGGGTLSTTGVVTDANGRAESILTLGPDPGTNTVAVSVTGLEEEQSVSATAGPPPIPEDVNRDDVVNILDLVLVAANLGDQGTDLPADVNGDEVVNILDLVLVAGALGNAAAPSSDPRALAMLTAAEVAHWLPQAQILDLSDATTQIGVLVLEQLAAALTPESTALLPNYPNPFNPETWIPYQLSRDAEVTLTIYDANGLMVRRLEMGHQPVGYYSDRRRAVHWDGRNDFGESVASGVYFYHLTAREFSATRKMLILK